MHVALIITSHKDNTIALEHLLESLAKCNGIQRLRVLVVVGGYYDNEEYVIEQHPLGAILIRSPYNSIDFTGLLAILDIDELIDESYVYIHDTTRVGPRFVERILDLAPGIQSASFKFPSMNMGLYSRRVIHASKDLLETFRNKDPFEVQRLKTRCVDLEDCIFKTHSKDHVFLSSDGPDVSAPMDYYGTGTPRIVEYYHALDLYKIKANWYTKSTYQLSL